MSSKYEIARSKMEPDANLLGGATETAAVSQAISLKRIADVLEKFGTEGGLNDLLDIVSIRTERAAYDAGTAFSSGNNGHGRRP